MRGRRRDHVLALAGTDFHDQRIVVAPRVADIRRIENETFANIQRPLARVDVQQIDVGIIVPGALQSRVEPRRPPDEGKHLAPVQGRISRLTPLLRIPRVTRIVRTLRAALISIGLHRHIHILSHTLIYRGNAGTLPRFGTAEGARKNTPPTHNSTTRRDLQNPFFAVIFSFVVSYSTDNGRVAQLVRAPPCHGGGHQFKSGRGRH